MAHIQNTRCERAPVLRGETGFLEGETYLPQAPQQDRGESTPGLALPASAKPSAEATTSEPDLYPGLKTLTCSFVIRIDGIFPCGVNPQEGLVVIVFIPVEGEHPRASALWVATQEVRQDACQLCEGLWPARLHEGLRHPQQVLDTLSMDELGQGKGSGLF